MVLSVKMYPASYDIHPTSIFHIDNHMMVLHLLLDAAQIDPIGKMLT